MDNYNHASWEAFKEHCAARLNETKISPFTIYHWLQAIRKTKQDHLDAIEECRYYQPIPRCALCIVSSRLQNYFPHSHHNFCAYCPWNFFVANIDEIEEYSDLDDNNIVPCDDAEDLTIDNITSSYDDNHPAIQRLTIWEDLLCSKIDHSIDTDNFDAELPTE